MFMKKLILCMSLCLGIVTQLSEAIAATRTITVTASPADKGSVRGAGTYEEGEKVYLVAVPNSGRLFLQWSDGNTSNPREITVGTDPDSYTAQFAAADFEYHFDWASDVNAANSGTVKTFTQSGYTYYINRVSIWKDYVTNSAVGYPGINIDMCSNDGSTTQGYTDYGNGKRFAYPTRYSTINTTDAVDGMSQGRIIQNAVKYSDNGNYVYYDMYTRLYLSALESYDITWNEATISFATTTGGYPFILVDGNFGTTRAFITIGTAPTFTVTLDDKSATTPGTTSVSVTYGTSTNLLTPVTKPKKTGYRFMGYTARDGNSNARYMVIDKNGCFMPARGLTTARPYISTSYYWALSDNVTLYAIWEEGEEEEETPTYTVTWKSEDGESTLETDADLAADAATSFDGAAPTKAGNAQYSYSFDGWTTAANGSGTFYADGETPVVSGDATYYAHFSQSTNNYTVSIAVSPAGYGTVDHASVASVPYGTNITNSSNTVTINGTTVTATPTAADAQYTYTFDSWGNGSATVTGNLTVTANFTRTTNNYTVAASVSPVGAGSVSGTGTFAYDTDVTLTATPTNRRWQFVRWTESAVQKATTASYTIHDIDAAHTLVAEFEEIPVTLADNEESSYYSSTLSTFTGSMDFQLMRTFYADMWNTVCFPFALSSSQIAASDMSGATFYTLTSVTGDAAEGLDFNVSEVTSLSARTPYLVQFTGSDIENPVFAGVTLDGSAFTNNTIGQSVGETSFFGTVHPTDLAIGENSGFLFLGQDNNLYWPNVNNDIRAFRAYFYSGNSTVQAVRPRARIVVNEQTATGNSGISAGGADGSSAVNARKYLHNGVLVIERDGVKYNAVGEKIE